MNSLILTKIYCKEKRSLSDFIINILLLKLLNYTFVSRIQWQKQIFSLVEVNQANISLDMQASGAQRAADPKNQKS